ncbi:hypothetical protein JNO42_03175 [Pseudomonas putida]|uniref:hypothetical protein n=1 Tax=Pseudomonas putida TaxID=303 RepID=UPI001EF86F39|nr:hypothetical protein [Pseudomonas putida]ULL06028.1 hypothetical protein JNO42_03175 [Pseudomonas putida]
MSSIDQSVAKAIAAVPVNKKVLYINQLTGSDTADGSYATPLKTLEKAIAMTPTGGLLSARLLADYAYSAHVTVEGISLEIRSDTIGTKRALKPAYFSDTDGVISLASLAVMLGGQISMRDVSLQLPTVNGIATPPVGGFNTAIKSNTTGTSPFLAIKMINCEIVDAPGATASLCSPAGMPLLLAVTGVSFPASFGGRYVAGVTSGVSANTLPHVVTNVATL